MKKRVVMLLAGIAVIVALVWVTDFTEVHSALMSLDISILFLLCFVQLSKYLLLSLQWKSIAKVSGHDIRFETMAHIILSGKFIESVTPGFKVGGEITKTVMLTKHTSMSMPEAIAVTATQKTLNVLAFVFVCIISVFSLFTSVELLFSLTLKNTILLSLLALISFAILLLFMIIKPQWASKLLPKAGVERFGKTVSCMYKRPLWLFGQMLLTLFVWSTYAIVSIVAARAMGISIEPLYVVIATYLSYMMGMIPLLPGGLGTTEAGLAGILRLFGVGFNSALALTLVLRFVTYWFMFLISALWFVGTRTLGIVQDKQVARNINTPL